MPKLLAIVGPTAVGKSKVAFELAKRVGGEVISADSMQVYQGMDIGTAKPSSKIRKEVKHHLLDLISLSKNFSVAEYQKLARKTIAEISQRGKLPILVGGSGLYIRAAIDKLEFPKGQVDSKIRKVLEEKAQKEGRQALYEELKKLDPKAAEKIHPHNLRRIIRALEVIKLTGRPFSEFQKEWVKRESLYDLKIFGLTLPRQKLYESINKRIDEQLKKGLVEEVKALISQGYEEAITAKQAPPRSSAWQALAYKEILGYLKRDYSLEEAVSLTKKRTRKFAKRQLTWFKVDPRITWLDAQNKTPTQIALEIITLLAREKFLKPTKENLHRELGAFDLDLTLEKLERLRSEK